MTSILFNPKIDYTIYLLVEKFIHINVDNSSRNMMKQKGVFRKICTMKSSGLDNRNSCQDDNEILIVVVLAPFRHDHNLLSFLPVLLFFLVFVLSSGSSLLARLRTFFQLLSASSSSHFLSIVHTLAILNSTYLCAGSTTKALKSRS